MEFADTNMKNYFIETRKDKNSPWELWSYNNANGDFLETQKEAIGYAIQIALEQGYEKNTIRVMNEIWRNTI
jgi:hypothetical protein